MIKVCLDAGHGMSNASPGKYDSGAVSRWGEEADLALKAALTFKFVFEEEGIPWFLTRTDGKKPAPLSSRVKRAQNAGCSHIISFHMNSAEGNPSGIETFYKDIKSLPFAERIQAFALLAFTGDSRGVKHESESARKKLFILSKPISCLCEMGFMNSAADVLAVADRAKRMKFASYAADYFKNLMEKEDA